MATLGLHLLGSAKFKGPGPEKKAGKEVPIKGPPYPGES